MEFFNGIKWKLKLNNVLWMLISLAVITLFGLGIISNGFSSEVGWRIGIKGSDTGIPVPNWLISVGFIIIALIFVYLFLTSLKSFIKNTEFTKFIKSIERIGDVEQIGNMLSALPKSPYVKGGDLRYNNQLLFYMKGSDCKIIKTSEIKLITPQIRNQGNTKELVVNIITNNGPVSIIVKKNRSNLLAEDIAKFCRQ